MHVVTQEPSAWERPCWGQAEAGARQRLRAHRDEGAAGRCLRGAVPTGQGGTGGRPHGTTGTLTHSGRGPLLGAHEPPHGVVAAVAVLPVEAVPPSWRGEQGSAAPAPPRAGGLGSGRRLGEGGQPRAAPRPAPARAARGSPSRNSSQRRLPLDSLR